MSGPAAEPDRRAAHFLSLLPWTARDLEPVLEAAQGTPGALLRDRTVLFLSDGPVAELEVEDLWRGASDAGARVRQVPFPPAGELPEGGSDAAVWVADAPDAGALRQLVRRAPRPVAVRRGEHNDPVRALQDVAAVWRRFQRSDLRVHWWGEATPRLHGWIELSTKFPLELDVDLVGPVVPDPAVTEFARVRSKGAFHLPARRDAAAAAEVYLWRHDPGARQGPGDLWIPLAGDPPWPRAWDRACAVALLEELVRRREGTLRAGEGS